MSAWEWLIQRGSFLRRSLVRHDADMVFYVRFLGWMVMYGSGLVWGFSAGYAAETSKDPVVQGASDALARTQKAAAQVPAVRLGFVQTKRLEMLDEPLVTPGVLEIDRVHARMRWQFDHGATLILAGGKLRRWGADGREENFGNDPSAKAMVGQMQGVLSGDWKVLGELFVLRSDALQIEGTPRSADLARYVERMVIAIAADGSPQKIELFTPGGDCTTYTFAVADTTWVPQEARFSGP